MKKFVSSPQLMILFGIFAILIIFALIWILSLVLPSGIDWNLTYRPATLTLLSGNNPYSHQVIPEAPFVAAPWTLIPLIPFAVLPEQLGRAGIFLISFIALAYSAHKLGGNRYTIGLFLLSPPIIHSLVNSNIEWLPIFGFVLPPQIGLFFVSTKPQTGIAVAIFWLFLAWKNGGLKEVARVFTPITIALIGSILVFGFWPLSSVSVIEIAENFNASLWPSSLSIGIAFLFLSFKFVKKEFAMAASPFLSPYVLFHSYSSSVAALITSPIALLATNLALWVLVFLRFLQLQ